MKVYISGPMTGIPDYNFPAFNTAAERWRAEGWEVVNPAENFGGRVDLTRPEYMRLDIQHLLNVDALAVLAGWQRSKGASLEVAIAQELGLPIYNAGTMQPYHETALEEAKRLVYGDRGAAYGHPLDDYTRTAALWSAILGHPVTAEQAVMCMITVKLSRECNHGKRDNRVDMAGYAECLQRIADERAKRQQVAPLMNRNGTC